LSQAREALLARFRAGLLERVRSTQRLVGAYQATSDPESLRHALGELHTLKGESRMLGLADVSELAHALETELGTAQRFSLALGAFDAMLGALTSPDGDGDGALRDALLSLRGAERSTSRPAPAPATPPSASPSPLPSAVAAPEPAEARPERAPPMQRFMQVDAAQIDLLCERVAELTAVFGQLETNADELLEERARHAKSAKLLDGFERCRALLDEATATAWTLRLLPIEPLLEELARHARKAAEHQQKMVEVQAIGNGVQLERDVADQLWDSLLHLVQNAVDHGLELPDARGSKPPVAQLKLLAESVGPSVVLRVEDDGRGIDPIQVRRVAVERGVITADVARELSDGQVTELLFEHGFSTRGETSRTSGRGVGLDVVEAGRGAAARGPEAELPDARRVDEEATARDQEQLPVSRRVAAALVRRPDRALALDLLAEQAIAERGLPHAGRADEGDGLPCPDLGAERVEAGAGERADERDRRGRGDVPRRVDVPLRIRADIGLVEHEDRTSAAVEDGIDVALEAAQVEVGVQRRDDEHLVDVGREHLSLHCGPRGLAAQARAPRERVHDVRRPGAVARPEAHPVTDGGERRAVGSLVREATADHRDARAIRGLNVVPGRGGEDDARRLHGILETGELAREEGSPSKPDQIGLHFVLRRRINERIEVSLHDGRALHGVRPRPSSGRGDRRTGRGGAQARTRRPFHARGHRGAELVDRSGRHARRHTRPGQIPGRGTRSGHTRAPQGTRATSRRRGDELSRPRRKRRRRRNGCAMCWHS